MVDSPQGSAEAVASLFAERQRYEAWLATLDAKRAVTPPHIYTRVHADYTARLQRVNEQLVRHRTALREMETEFIDRLTSLDIDEAKYKDELAEADLRANVGELDGREFREILERTALGLEQVTAERLRATTELTNLRAMLGDDGEIGVLEIGTSELTVTRTPPAVPIPPAPEKRASRAGPASRPAEEERDSWGLAPTDPLAVAPNASAPARSEETVPSSPFDDLEFLRSMIESRNTGETAVIGNGATPSSTPAAAPSSGKRSSKETPPAEPAARSAPPAATARASTAEPAGAPSPSPSASAASAAALPAKSSAASAKIVNPSISMELEPVAKRRGAPETVPSYLRDMPPEQVKTLKCQECGTLNYPTEWYCERCGAELAAL